MQINELPFGSIIWQGDEIVGIKGITLDENKEIIKNGKFEKVIGNPYDFELVK